MPGSTRASAPSTRSGVAVPPLALRAIAVSSSTGLAWRTWGCVAKGVYRASSSAPCMARTSRSGWPLTLRTAWANSSSAELLMSCTANASATPSITATTAAALRQGWWRSSCQEKVRSKVHMGRIVRAECALCSPWGWPLKTGTPDPTLETRSRCTSGPFANPPNL